MKAPASYSISRVSPASCAARPASRPMSHFLSSVCSSIWYPMQRSVLSCIQSRFQPVVDCPAFCAPSRASAATSAALCAPSGVLSFSQHSVQRPVELPAFSVTACVLSCVCCGQPPLQAAAFSAVSSVLSNIKQPEQHSASCLVFNILSSVPCSVQHLVQCPALSVIP